MITVNALRPADIIVSTTNARVSAVIRAGIGSSVSHSMIYVGGSNVVEAIDTGVTRQPIVHPLQEAVLAIGLRRRNLTDKQRGDVIKYANQFTTRPYDFVGAAGSGASVGRGTFLAGVGCALSLRLCAVGALGVGDNGRPENADSAFFCSELVARCFELAGAPLLEGSPSFTTPRQIRMANTLLYLGKLKDTPKQEPGIAFGSPL
jgi:hypothetical protein